MATECGADLRVRWPTPDAPDPEICCQSATYVSLAQAPVPRGGTAVHYMKRLLESSGRSQIPHRKEASNGPLKVQDNH